MKEPLHIDNKKKHSSLKHFNKHVPCIAKNRIKNRKNYVNEPENDQLEKTLIFIYNYKFFEKMIASS